MNSKTISFTLGILALVFLSLTMVSALVVTSSSPANATSQTSTSTTFSYTVDEAAASCSLILNGALNSTVPVSNSFSVTNLVVPSNNTWFVSCTNSTATVVSETRTLIITSAPSITISQSGLTKTSPGTVSIVNNGNIALNNVQFSSLNDADFNVIFNPLSFVSIAPGQTLTTAITSTNNTLLSLGDDDILTIKVTTDKANATTSVSVPVNFCRNGSVGNLDITDFSITNFGDGNSDSWKPLDEVEIEVEVSNLGESDISSVNVQLKILDVNGKDVTKDFDLNDNIISLGRIADNSEELAIFQILSVPADIDAGDYKIFARTYKSGSENIICNDNDGDSFSQITIEKEDQAVIIDKNDLLNIPASCNDNIHLAFDVINIGNDKEDSVLVTIFNNELGISQSQVISDLRENEREVVEFDFRLPANLTKTKYVLFLTTYFDYKGGSRDPLEVISYDLDSDNNLDESYSQTITVSNCQIASTATISASLTSEAAVGKEMTVLATITNSGTATDFVVTPINYDSWAELVSVNPPTSITISQGTSKQVTFTFKPTKSGTQTFDIQTINNGKTSTQAVQVDVAQASGFSDVFSNLGSNTMFIIAAVLIILIIVVIILIVRVSSRKTRSSDF